MSFSLVVVQLLNGVQLGPMLFLMASGLTFVLGMMSFINLAHGSCMIGPFIALSLLAWTGNFMLRLLVAVAGAGIVGLFLEIGMLRKVYQQSHLHVLITFGLVLVFNELARLTWGPFLVPLPVPALLVGSVEILVCAENLVRLIWRPNRLRWPTMVALIFLFLNLVASFFKSKSRLEAENAALRQQLIVLQRKVRGRVQFTNSDRLFFIQLYRWCPSVLKAMIIIRPAGSSSSPSRSTS